MSQRQVPYTDRLHGDGPRSAADIAADASHSRALTIRRTHDWGEAFDNWRVNASNRLNGLDLTPDLADAIGSRRWFRGLATLFALLLLVAAAWPDFSSIRAAQAVELNAVERDEVRTQMILPLALGADSGRHMGATPVVTELARAPERPQMQLLATLAQGDSFSRMLQRAGVGRSDAARVAQLVSGTVPLSDIASGTQVDITLGRREVADQPRPLDSLAFRARFDLKLAVERTGDNLALRRIPIRVDDTPLRIRGLVGNSLYRSARAAGAPASAVQQYLRTLGDRIDMDRAVVSTDTFDIIVAHRRAATGERQAGKLLYAGVERGGKPTTQLMRWGSDEKFYEASGVGEQRSGLMRPVSGPVSSRYGMRRHPILGYRRMHAGLDFRARHGTPIVAVTDGTVSGAGRMGGCGNAVRLGHGGGLATRYCHMSRIAVRNGQRVNRGQVIGYVGSTGLSTGPHLHYEMYRGGRSINPESVQFVTRAQLSGPDLAQFRAGLAQLKQVEPGAALAALDSGPRDALDTAPMREIDKVDRPRPVG